jgi:hypothetical protein
MNRCIYSKCEFDLADGEHIMQNFLGARWVSNKIVCNDIQEKFGKSIDKSLESGFQVIRNLLGTKGGRGGEGPILKNITSSKGNKYHLRPGGMSQIAKPIITSSPLLNGNHSIQIKCASKEQFGWAIALLKKKFPDIDIDLQHLLNNSYSHSSSISEQLYQETNLGGSDFFRGSLKSIFNLLGAENVELAFLSCFDNVRSFINDGNGEWTQFVRWIYNEKEIDLPKIGEFDHFIAVYSKLNYVYGFSQYFGEVSFIYLLTDSYGGSEFQYGYLVNPFRDTDPSEQRNPAYQIENVPLYSECSNMPDEQIGKLYSKRISSILYKYYDRVDREGISNICDSFLLRHQGELCSAELTGELIQKLSQYILSRINFHIE